jgi:(2Fe-2S) ferredoxin
MKELIFDKHIFICCNQRSGNERLSCGEEAGLVLTAEFKKQIKDKKLPISVRAQKAGCLGICDFGATVAVYPEGIFYVGVQLSDVSEIVNSHIENNIHVERLILHKSQLKNG